MLGVEVEEAALVRAGRVEDEVGEAEVGIEPDLLHVLLWVRRDNPAARRALRGQRVRQALHLQRVFYAGLFLSAERQGAPVAGVLQGALPIGIEGDLHLDELVERRRVAAGLAGTLLERRQELLAVERLALAAGADEAVRHPAGIAGHLRAASRHVERDAARGRVVHRGVTGLVERAVEADTLCAPQAAHELNGLAQ